MVEHLLIHLSNLLYFAINFMAAAVLTVGFAAIYIRTTPHGEIGLIREGNVAAAMNLGGALIGFAIPLASVIVSSQDLLDMALWGVVAMLVQLVAYQGLRLVFRDLTPAIAGGRVSVGLFDAAVSIAIGILNAACLSY